MENTPLSLLQNEIIEIRNNLQMLILNDEINAGTESNIKTILTKRVANGILQSPTLSIMYPDFRTELISKNLLSSS